MELPDRLRRFVAEPGAVPVEDALLSLAGCRPGPPIDEHAALATLDETAAGVAQADVDGVCSGVFVRAGFTGDTVDYHAPDNSLLDRVIARRVGMPITLAVVALAVARRVGVRLDPIGAPGHFLLHDPERREFRDPYGAGERIDAVTLRAALERSHPSAGGADGLLTPVADDAIVSRVLNNLQNTYASRDVRGLDWVLGVRLALPAALHGDPLVLATLCERRGRYGESAAILGRLAERLDDDALRDRAVSVAARLN